MIVRRISPFVWSRPDLGVVPSDSECAVRSGLIGDQLCIESTERYTRTVPVYIVDGVEGSSTSGVLQLVRSAGSMPSSARSNDAPPSVDR